MKDLFIFDLDGTLVDAYEAVIWSFNSSMKAFGYPEKSRKVIRKAVGWGDRKLIAPFVKSGDLDKVLGFYRNHHRFELRKKSRWMPGAVVLLRALKKQRIKTAIASNRPAAFTSIILKALKGARFFDKVVCADSLSADGAKFFKPNPLILKTILSGMGFPSSGALYIGDMVIDIRTARRAGIESAVVATGSSSFKELRKEKPDHLFRSLAELKRELVDTA